MSLVFRARDSVTGQAKAVTAADAGTALTDLVPDNTARNAAAAAQATADRTASAAYVITTAPTLVFDAALNNNAHATLNQVGHTFEFQNVTPGARGTLRITVATPGDNITSWVATSPTITVTTGVNNEPDFGAVFGVGDSYLEWYYDGTYIYLHLTSSWFAASAAQTAADNAQGTADAGVSDAANAQTAANTAQGAADAALYRAYTAYTENVVAAGTAGTAPTALNGTYLNSIDTVSAGVDEDVMLPSAVSRGQEIAAVNLTASTLYVWGDAGNAATDTLLGSTFPVTVPANSMKQFLCVALGVWAVN